MGSGKTILLLTITLLCFIALTQIVSADTYHEKINPTFDGHVNQNDKTMDNASIYATFRETGAGGVDRRAYFEWDISSIPDSADIIQVNLVLYIQEISQVRAMVFDMYNQPSVSTGLQMWNDCANGTKYCEADWGNSGWKNRTYAWETSFEENLSRDWWALGITAYASGGGWSGGNVHSMNNSDPNSYPYLWVTYNLTAPVVNDSLTIPSDYNTSALINGSTCINITHDHGNDMNITWYYWNGTGWEVYGTNGTDGDGHTINNGTYCQGATWATEPCTTYYWYVDVADEYDNHTIVTYTFTTHCIDPPTSFTCDRNGTTGLNLTFTEMPSYGGTVYTEAYYIHGGIPPANYGQGTLAGNTTDELIEITGLDEGQCYGIALWTVWESPDGVWYVSDSANGRACCAAGGDYRVAFFWEEPKPYQPINFSLYPAKLGTHIIKIHYYDNSEDDFTIDEGVFVGGTLEFDTTNNTYYINISATNEIWFVELLWFDDFNESGLLANQTSRSPYRRILTPFAVQNVSLDGEYKETFFFYLANLTVYGSTYYYNNGTAIATLTDSDFENSVVKYDYSFADVGNQIMSHAPNNIFFTLYERNITGDVIIHQEYVDTSRHINPALIYEKKYLMGVNVTDDTSLNIYNLGLAPTDNNLAPSIIITREFSEETLAKDIDITYETGGSYLNITYHDSNSYTQSVTMYVFENNISGTEVFNQTVASSYKIFRYNGYNSSKTYVIYYEADLEHTEEDYTYDVSISSLFLVFSQIAEQASATNINIILISVLGTCPIPGFSWMGLFLSLFIGITTFAICIKSIPGGLIAGAVLSFFFNVFIGELNLSLVFGGILLGVLGIIALITGDKK